MTFEASLGENFGGAFETVNRKMETQRNELIALAKEHGWRATQTDNFDAFEWSVETWELESEWSPAGVKAYVTFPIDEQIYRERRPWAIRVTPKPPAFGQGVDDSFECSLKQWENEKQAFVKFLDKLRLVRD